jgi:hypothetical protein
MSRDSSVDIAMGYGLDVRVSIPGRGMIFLFSTMSRLVLGPTQHPTQWVPGAPSPSVKREGREADQSRPSSAEVRHGAAIPSLPHMSSFHSDQSIKHRGNSIL